MQTRGVIINDRLIFTEVEDRVSAIIEKIDTLTIEEISLIAEHINSNYTPMATKPPINNTQTRYGVKLISSGMKKIAVIKLTRTVNLGMGLKEAKDLTDNLPAIIKYYNNLEDANSIISEFHSLGNGVVAELIIEEIEISAAEVGRIYNVDEHPF